MLCRQEQEVLQAAAEQEHNDALLAAKAAVASGRKELQQMQQQAQHMAWRGERWQLASRRRTTLQVMPYQSMNQSSLIDRYPASTPKAGTAHGLARCVLAACITQAHSCTGDALSINQSVDFG